MGKKNDGAIFLELPETEEWKKLGLKDILYLDSILLKTLLVYPFLSVDIPFSSCYPTL